MFFDIVSPQLIILKRAALHVDSSEQEVSCAFNLFLSPIVRCSTQEDTNQHIMHHIDSNVVGYKVFVGHDK